MVATQVDFERGEVRVHYDADRAQVGQLAERLERAGYPALGPPRFSEAQSTAAPDGHQQ